MPKEISDKRFCGTEVEYGYRLAKGDTTPISHTDQLFPPRHRHIGQYLDNGARLYPDVGFVEYATPECDTLDALVAHEIAGEDLAWQAYGNGRSRIVTLHKRSLTPNGAYGNGFHENYGTTIDIWGAADRDQTIQTLATFFAARTIITGAGLPTKNGFALGQKLHNITEESGGGATASKALVNTRDEPHSGGSKIRRYHHVAGDANMSPWVIRMRTGMTSLMLRLAEQKVDMRDLFLSQPLKAAQQVASSVDGIKVPLERMSGKTITAVELLEEYRQRAETLGEERGLPPTERQIIPVWETIDSALSQYADTREPHPLMEKLDWYTKLAMLQKIDEKRQEKGRSPLTLTQKQQFDLLYDQIPNGIGRKLREGSGKFAEDTPTSRIRRAKHTPPPGRARMRRAVIDAHDGSPSIRGQVGLSWDSYSVNGTVQRLGLFESYDKRGIAKKMKPLVEFKVKKETPIETPPTT